MVKVELNGLDRFIHICKDPLAVKEIVLDPKNVNPNSRFFKSVYWHDLSLADGFPSLILFFSTLDSLYPKEKFDLIAHRYVLKIKETLEKNGLPEEGSLFSGTAGLCNAFAFASKKRSRYSKILSNLEEHLYHQTLLTYIPHIEQAIRSGTPLNYKLYDLISGFAGIGLYFLQNNITKKSDQIIKKLLRLSVDMTTPIRHYNHLVPGWICAAEFLKQKEDRLLDPMGIFNMGLAHGVPSLLGFMATALKGGIQVSGQIEAMKTIIEWLKSKITTYQESQFFRAKVTFEEEINKIPPHAKSLVNREAWCYGTPGVARTLYLAGKALNDLDTIDFGAKAFLSIFQRPYEQWNLAGPTFCHGTAGLLLITHLMAKDLESSFLSSKVQELESRIFNSYNEDYLFGFRDLDLCKDGSYCPLDKSSLLTGATGVWLTLLNTKSTEPSQWHYPFMIDYV